ncbi:unnamed protein product, partial [Iphiclides podalirius]
MLRRTIKRRTFSDGLRNRRLGLLQIVGPRDGAGHGDLSGPRARRDTGRVLRAPANGLVHAMVRDLQSASWLIAPVMGVIDWTRR